MDILGNVPLVGFLNALWLWALNMIDGYVFDLGFLGFGLDLLGLTSTFG